MSKLSDLFPPLEQRLAEGRPVLAKEQVVGLTKKILDMTSSDTVEVSVAHTAQVVTRMANSQVLSGDDGDELRIEVGTSFGARQGITVQTNQIDEATLKAMVQQCESMARDALGSDEIVMEQPQIADELVPTQLWKDSTIQAMTATRDVVIPEVLSAVKKEGLSVSGFLGLMARSEALMTKKNGISVYSEETDGEVTVTARTKDGKSSGWGGMAHRDWTRMNHMAAAARAIEMAQLGKDPVALEPGRRTAILTPAAVVQIFRFLASEYDASPTDQGRTGFSRMPSGNKLQQRVFDPRISMNSDPNDPDGGYRPYFGSGFGSPAMKWVENGVLKNLAYSVGYAMGKGKQYSERPFSIRVSVTGGPTLTIPEMVAQCKEGILVNRFSSVDLVDLRTGLTTGTTRDGCFLVKDGKISKGLKNFRFLDSPFFFLNNIEALGVPERAAFGYTPPGNGDAGPTDWPRRPIIAPPMMVKDFNFSALADAV